MFKSIKFVSFIITIPVVFIATACSAQKTTIPYATRDTQVLKMDIYAPSSIQAKNPCVIFVFGGGFFTGRRDEKLYIPYFKTLTDSGYVVASIDYRLGLKNLKKPPSILNRKPLIHAISIAVDDLFAATKFLLDHANEYGIDTAQIIISGSSAGAITALTADFQKRNGRDDHVLPADFQYKGIISFAGAVYSNHGRPGYKVKPAPMLLFHGNKDDVVPFKKKSLFGTGIYGSSIIIKDFMKDHDPYWLYIFDGIGHDASVFPMVEYLSEIHQFLRELVREKRPLYIEEKIRDDDRKNSPVNFNKVFKKRK